MRLLLATAVLLAAPAMAAPKEAPKPSPITVPPELSDPAVADKLGRMSGALAKAMLDMPVGELEAAVEGRPATRADKARRVRDEVGGDDSAIERRVAAATAASGQAMQAATKALVASLPAILASLEGARVELEKATANLPDPTYPKR